MAGPKPTKLGDPNLPRIALIGCGAISELYHLPALEANDALSRVVLVDSDAERIRALSDKYQVAGSAGDFRDVIDDVDGAIVATPPNSHLAICLDLVQKGRSVLCEKPLAPTAPEAAQMVAAASSAGVAICVNQTRRWFPTNRKVRELIEEGALGVLRSIEYIDGTPFNWPTASGFYFDQGAPGIVADRGVHSIDLMCWWLGAKPELVYSLTDSFGGPESMAMIRLQHDDCQIDVKLSWLTSLQNTFRVTGDRATVRGDIGRWRSLELTDSSGTTTKIKLSARETAYNDFGTSVVANFIKVLEGKAEPYVSGASVLPTTELIDESYSRAERMHLPWLFDGAAP